MAQPKAIQASDRKEDLDKVFFRPNSARRVSIQVFICRWAIGFKTFDFPFFMAILALLVVQAGALCGFAHIDAPPLAALSSEERAWLDQNRDKLILYYNTEFPPIEFAGPEGEFTGLGADVFAEIEKRLGVTFLRQPSDDWNAHLAALESGECAIAPTIVRTDERERFAYFTTPYATVPVVIITSQSRSGQLTLDDLSGLRVAVVSGYASEKYVRDRAQDRFEILPVAAYFIQQEGIPNLRVAGRTELSFAWSIGVSRHYPLLYSAIQKALAEIPDAELGAMYRRWVSLSTPQGLAPEAVRRFILVIVFIVLLVAGLAGLTYYLKKRLNEKVASLRQTQQELLEQTEQLKLALEATNAGVWDLSLETGRAIVTEQWYTMHGFAPGTREIDIGDWMGILHPEDIETTRKILQDYIDAGGRGLYQAEFRMRQADGSWRWVMGKGRAIAWDDRGRPSRLIGLNLDIHKAREAQAQLETREAMFRAIFDSAPYAIAVNSLEDGTFLDANKTFLESRGLKKEDLADLRLDDLHFTSEKGIDRIREILLRDGAIRNVEATVRRAGDSLADIIYSSVLVDLQGQKRVLSMTVDVTDKKRIERALRESEEKFRAIFENAPIGIFRTSYDGRLVEINLTLARMLGYESREDALASVQDLAKEIYPRPEDRQRLLDALVKSPRGVRLEIEIKRKDGTLFRGVINASLQMDSAGRPTYLDGTIEDITEIIRTEEALRASESKLRSLFAAMRDVILVLDSEGRYLEIAPTDASLLYRPAKELLGKTVSDVFPPEKARMFLVAIRQALSGGKPVSLDYDLPIGSRQVWFAANLSPLASDRVLLVARDITERKIAEAERDRLMAAIEQSGEIVVITDPEGTIQYVNTAFEQITGYSRQEAVGRKASLLKSGAHDTAFYAKLWDTITRGQTWKGRFINKRKDGSRYTEETTISPVCDTSGRIVNYVAAKRDISGELALEEQSRQMQKMDAIGQLTGGVAHDFNNLLQVINGYTDMAMQEMLPGSPAHDLLGEVSKAGQRASNLVRQLLLFSRRQVMQPRFLDLNAVVEDMLKMLGRVIGEHIRLNWKPQKNLGVIHADSGMLDQLLMNLSVNARDAMPEGGVLTIETQRVRLDSGFCASHAWARPGQFALLTVSDTGCGMTREGLDHIFDPFFTTKGEGKGTGLGLSTVYGIVKQHEGMIYVYSEPGRGSAFKIYLPLRESDLPSSGVVAEEPAIGGTETILLAEDDAMVRDLARKVLERAGYRVLIAQDGEEAVALFKQNMGAIALLLFDGVMPRLGGYGALERIRAISPSVPVLFSSGYSEQGIHADFVLHEVLNLIQKPYSPNDLLRAVRAALESTSSGIGECSVPEW
jgi:PAS domain S-box-containing protein